jgi:signal transduction histidine kinase
MDNKLDYIYILFYCVLFAIISYLIITLIDNSESVIELNGTIKRLEKEKLLRNSLFKITHEIKNPIAVCKGYLDMMDTNNTKQVSRYVPIIKQEINRTLTLMTDFLSLTKLKINKNVLDITALLEDVCYDIEILSDINKIDFEYKIPDEEIYIDGDYDRLKQVLINIIKNSIEAIDSSKKGNIKLSVKIEKKHINIIIKDNGLGMNEETLKRVGEAFFTTKQNGTGLGIKLSKEIIEGHDGEIIYDSKEGKETTATIRLPIKIST